jgi:chromate transport protein ChrA
LVAWLLGCLVAWLLGCLVAWLLGCLVAWLLGCLVAWIKKFKKSTYSNRIKLKIINIINKEGGS